MNKPVKVDDFSKILKTFSDNGSLVSQRLVEQNYLVIILVPVAFEVGLCK